jgi:Ser/Thr protein kinase RdoA (MazF antagonist)
VHSHRDLTTANVLDCDGEAVFIDWESAGPVGVGAELGRTAFDHELDDEDLVAFLSGYSKAAPVPNPGPDWMTLWIRALVVFEAHCRSSLAAGTAPASLCRFQQHVVETTPGELRRRLAIVNKSVDRFSIALERARERRRP